MGPRIRMRHWKRWLLIGVAGAPYVYIHFIEGPAPPPLSLSSPSATSTTGATLNSGEANVATDGSWTVAEGSVVGYRVKEILFGQSNEAVGRTNAITGSLIVTGTTVTDGRFTVDMTTVASDQSRRDNQFNGRNMETSTYPTATFVLTEPIELGSIPPETESRTLRAEGELMLHGITKSIAFDVTGRCAGSTVQISGSIPIVFADWSIPNPSFGPISTEDHRVLEFALNFTHA